MGLLRPLGSDKPNSRFNHSAVTVKSRLYIFGGFDGKYRLNDIHYFQIEQDLLQPSTLLKDLAGFVNNEVRRNERMNRCLAM